MRVCVEIIIVYIMHSVKKKTKKTKKRIIIIIIGVCVVYLLWPGSNSQVSRARAKLCISRAIGI